MDEHSQDIIDALIDHIDKAIAKGSVTNQQVAAVFDFLNEKLKSADWEKYIRKDQADSTSFLLSLFAGAHFGNFVPGIIGAIIDQFGDGEMGSLVLRKFLSIPELRFNRAIVYKGKQIISPGGGCLIESFTLNGNGTWTVAPKLEEGEPLSQEMDDILLAYWHDKDVTTGAFKGFREMKFRVVSVDSDARTFVIAPKPDSLSVPAIAMTLAQVGNFTNKERQTYIMIDSTLGNNNITFFDDCNTWDIEERQEQSWFGKKKGRTVSGIDASDYSAVLKHVIMTGLIFQIDEISGELVRVPCDKGAHVPEQRYAYYDRVSSAGALWLCVNEKGTLSTPADGSADWLKQVSEGDKGDAGIGISASDVLYYLSTSPTALEGGDWQTDAPVWQSGKYMWTKTKIVYTDNSTMESTPVCITGGSGKGVSTIVEQYYLSTSSTSLTGGSWKTSAPTWKQGSYVWTRSVVTYTDNTTTTTDAVCVSGSKGDTGDAGLGISSADVLYYLSTSPTALEDGNWQTDAPVWQSGKYMWTKTRIVYTDNSTMESTPVCITGGSGKGVSTIVEQYYLSTSSTSLTGGSWKTSAPTWKQGSYVWTRSVVTYTDNTTTTTDAVCVSGSKGNTGDAGLGISSADVLYYLSTSPTALEDGNWQTDAPVWQSGKYMWTKTRIVYTDNSTMESTPVCITGGSGKGVSTIVEQYYLSTSPTSLDGGSWDTRSPAWKQGHYVWTRSVVTYTDNTTTTTDAVCVSGSKGDKGDAGESIKMLGHWNSSMRPVPANCMVSYEKGVYLSLRETSQAPVSTLMYANGSYFLNETGGYMLASDEVNEDWELILENGKNGVSILFQGSFPAAPANPKDGWSYYNTSDKRSYVYQGGKWYLTSVDGKDGKGFEWIFTRTKTNEKPIALTSEQQDDYVPSGWTDDPVGCTAEYIYEWTCKRVKKDGVWGAYSAASIFNMYSFSTIPQWSINNVDWHDVFAPGDIYIRYSSDGGKTWTAGARAVGETGKDGPYTDFEFAVGESDIQAPANGWLDAPAVVPEGQYLWMRAQYIVPPATVNPSAWSYSRLTGTTGSTGQVGIIPCGHWQSANTPYKKTSLVTMHNATFVALVDTAKPPVWLMKWGPGPTDYLINHTGGYMPLSSVENNRNTEWLMITPPPVNGTDGNDGNDSTSYWLTCPVSTININSVGSLSPSAVLISCKKKKGEGVVSDCSDFFLAARKYNGSWLAHVSATKASSLSLPAVAGYTQFAVRAYNSAAEADAWGSGFVSEIGVGVSKDGSAGQAGPAGSFPRNCDIFEAGKSYVWNPSYRDQVLYPFDGIYYSFLVANYGATVTLAPTSASGDGLWESMGKYKSIATDTLFADGANVARFMFKNGVLRSQDETNGVPNLEMDGKTGKIKGVDVELSGKIEAKEDSQIAGMKVVGNSLRGVQATMGIYKHQITGNGSAADMDIIVNNIHQQQTYIFSITSSSNDIQIRLPSQHDMLLRGIDQYQFELTIVLDNLSYSSIRISCNDDATIVHNLKTFSTYGIAKGGVLKLLYFQNKYFLISNSWGQTSPW